MEANGFLLPQQNPPTVTLLLQAIYPQKVSFYYNPPYSQNSRDSWDHLIITYNILAKKKKFDVSSNIKNCSREEKLPFILIVDYHHVSRLGHLP